MQNLSYIYSISGWRAERVKHAAAAAAAAPVVGAQMSFLRLVCMPVGESEVVQINRDAVSAADIQPRLCARRR